MSNPRLVVLYGSQTGTAQDIAERIWREAKFFGFSGPFLCMDEYPVEELINEPLVIFVASTTGQGEEPDNMYSFWRFLLRRNLPPDSLKCVRYAVLGLGDSSYVKFNFVAKRLSRRLHNLGGVQVIDPGYADDQHDLGANAVVDPWLTNLWTSLGGLYNFTSRPIRLDPESRWNVSVNNDEAHGDPTERNKGTARRKKAYSQRNPCSMVVFQNTRTSCSQHFQDVRFLKMRVPETLKYNPGDVILLSPQNSDRNVCELFAILNENRPKEAIIKPDTIVSVIEKDRDLPVPESLRCPISLKDCAKKYWDLSAIPRRSVFELLAHVSVSSLEKEKLQEFSEATGQEELYNYCNRPRRTTLEVLADFPSATRGLTLDLLFDVFQPIRPRTFSIASSPTKHRGEIHVLLAVVQYHTKLLTPRLGLCSTYLADLPINSVVHGWSRSGSFRFPPVGTPVIMVGPGTGVAPFRSYIQELSANNVASADNLLLFFGCRSKKSDFHFREEWQHLASTNQLSIVTAFSRDQSTKVYVQHQIVKEGQRVWNMLKRQGFIFVAGSSKNMPSAVRQAFVKVVQDHGGMTIENAEMFISQMEEKGRYQTETWS